MSEKTNHGHPLHAGPDHEKAHRDPRPYWKRAHHDWRFLAAVFLMLVGIAIYVVTNDLRGRVPGQPQQPLPAAVGQ
jgi:hypothetical protein